MLTPRAAQGLQASIPGWLPPGSCRPGHRARPRPAGRLARAARGRLAAISLRTQIDQLRDDVRRVLRETASRSHGGIQVAGRGVQLRIPDAAERDEAAAEAARAVAADRQRGPRPDRRPRPRDRPRQPDGLIQLTLHRRGRQRPRPPRRRPGDRGHPPARRRARHDRAEHPAPGRRPHPGPGAGPAGPAAAEGDPRHDREARVPPAGRAGRRRRRRHAAHPGRERPALPVERRVIVEGGDLTDAQPGFDSRTSEPIVNFRFNIRGAQRFGQATTRECRPAPRDRARQRGDLGAAHPARRSPAARARSPAASRCSRPTTCGAAAGRRAAGEAHHRRGAHRRPGPRRGLDRGRQDGDLRRDRASWSSSCSRPTACSASSPTSRCWSTSG